MFSGSGLSRIQGKVMPGTPLVPLLRIQDGLEFDNYVFSDLKKEYVTQLRNRAETISGKTRPELRVEKYDFETAVRHFFSGTWPTYNYKDNAWLVTVDPFGMEISWDKITRILGSGSVDMLLTFMTRGFQRNRNLPQSEQTITKVFGNENWKTRQDWVQLYCEQIQNLELGNKKPYLTNIIAVENPFGNTYHLIFISTSEEGAHSSFEWIQEHIDQVSLDLLRDAFRGGTVAGSDLDHYT